MGSRYWGELLAERGVCLIADRMGVAPGGGGLCICSGGSFVKLGEKRAAFFEEGLTLLLAEPHEMTRL